jgi:uncharacterized integral membrane protein
MTPKPDEPNGRRREGIDERQARQVAIVGVAVLVIVLLLVFIVENSDAVSVSFVFFSADISLIWVIVLSALVGAVAGVLAARALRKRFGKPD